MLKNQIGVFAANALFRDEALTLANRLQLPFTEDVTDYEFVLVLSESGLGLKKTTERSLPLFVDFLSPTMTYRRKQTSLRKETLARAMGLKNDTEVHIVDATAGLARDSFILACLGFEVLLLERSPIICALVADGIKRALTNPSVAPIIKRLHLVQTNAIDWMQQSQAHNPPEIIYLDPMFPARTKSAQVKKDMQILHHIIGEDLDGEELLNAALACATKRVVVKRPRLAAHLAGLAPSFCLEGSSSRFDVYITSTMR